MMFEERHMTSREGHMDQGFEFLSHTETVLLREIVSRRNPDLYERFRLGDAVSRSDADEMVDALGDELTNNMDADWEPTDHGLTVSALLARFNAARIAEWP